MDPLTVLRDFVSGGTADQVVMSGDRVDFGSRYSFPGSLRTLYKSEGGKKDFYDLGSLVFFVKNFLVNKTKYTDYFRAAKAANVMAVSFLDRKDLEEYLTGKKDKSDFIVLGIPDLQVDNLEGPAAKKARLDEGPLGAGGAAGGDMAAGSDEDSTLKGILAHELQLRDRNSMLSVPNRNFSKVLALLSNVQKEEQRRQQAARPAAKPVLPIKGSGRYERQTQQDARLQQLGGDVLGTVKTGFVTASANPAAAGPSSAPGAPPPPPPPVQPPVPTARPAPDQQQQHRSHHHQSQHRSSGGSSRPGSSQGQQQRRSGTPIIMVPPALTSMVNMYNVQPFLEQGVFRTVEECRAELAASGGKKQDLIKVTRTLGRPSPVAYHVTDKEPERKEDWKRVVAVFCLGKPWQFKKWPFKGAGEGDLVETFSRVRGYFLHYSDEKVDPTVKGWNLRVVSVNREGRHRDVTVAQDIWSDLDAFLQAQKSTLAY
ncbi:hypothetical protein N2152v2_004694 [Parachlorella kessleri]